GLVTSNRRQTSESPPILHVVTTRRRCHSFQECLRRCVAHDLPRMATEPPAKCCALMANLIPQHFKVEHEQTLTMSVDELRAKMLEIRANATLIPSCSGRHRMSHNRAQMAPGSCLLAGIGRPPR